VTSTLVTGLAATTAQRTGAGAFATAYRTCVPAKQDEAWYLASVGVARYVVIAPDAFGAAQHREMRAPAIPQKFYDRDHDGNRQKLIN
jgi:hypothetical protein